jgi:hypothetical protein
MILHKQVIQIRTTYGDAERAVAIQSFLCAFQLDMHSHIRGSATVYNFNLSICAVIIAISALDNKGVTFLYPRLEGDTGRSFKLVRFGAFRKIIKIRHGASPVHK